MRIEVNSSEFTDSTCLSPMVNSQKGFLINFETSIRVLHDTSLPNPSLNNDKTSLDSDDFNKIKNFFESKDFSNKLQQLIIEGTK
jgi:hypothetical protein